MPPTTLSAPALPGTAVQRFRRALSARATFVLAPSGYGKTTLVRTLIGDRDDLRTVTLPRAELGLGELTALFLRATSSQISARGAVEKILASARGSATPAAVVAAWLDERLDPAATAIVLDNAEHLSDEGVALIAALVPLGERSWVIVQRPPVRLPLAEWLAHGIAQFPVDHEDLAFDGTALRALARARDALMPAKRAEEILRISGGWPAYVDILLRSGDLEERPANEETLIDVLRAQLPPVGDAVRTLLAGATLVEHDRALLARRAPHLTPDDLDRLARSIPLVAFDGTLRVHELLGRALRAETTFADAEALARDLARDLAELERPADAALVLIDAGLEREAVSVLETHALELVEHPVPAPIARVVAKHAGARAQTAGLALLQGRILEDRDAGDAAVTAYQRAFDLAQIDEALTVAALRIDTIRRAQQRLTDCDSILNLLIARLGGEECATALVLAQRALARSALGRFEEAESEIARAYARAEGDPTVLAEISRRATWVAMFAGNRAHVSERAAEARRLADALGRDDLLESSIAVEANLLYHRGELNAAMASAREFETLARKNGSMTSVVNALHMQFAIAAQTADALGAAEIEARLTQLRRAGLSKVASPIMSRALVATWTRAYRQAGDILEHGLDDLPPVERPAAQAMLAAMRALAGQSDAAEATLRAISLPAEATTLTDRMRVLIRAFYEIVAELALGRKQRAQKLLRNAERFDGNDLTQYARLQLLRVALEDPRESAIAEAAGRRHAGYVPLVRDALGAHRVANGEPMESGLTPTEQSILERLARGRSPAAIADDDGRSVATIRWHIRRLYGKLGSSSLSEALTIARDKGIVT